MNTPVFPLIDIYDEYFVDLVPTEAHLSRAPVTEILEGDNHSELYDGEGNVWHYHLVSKAFKDTFWNRVLAYTFYNPKYKATPVWTKVREYHIEDLKEVLLDCIDRDEEVLTQYERASVIRQDIEIAFSFNDLVDTLNKYVFDVNKKQLLAERQEREENR